MLALLQALFVRIRLQSLLSLLTFVQGIARVLSSPTQGNMVSSKINDRLRSVLICSQAVALLARRPEPLNDLVKSLRASNPEAVLETFPTDTQPDNLRKAFQSIKEHNSFKDLKLRVAIFSIKNSSKKPFMTETFEDFMAPLESYVGGAMVNTHSPAHHNQSKPY